MNQRTLTREEKKQVLDNFKTEVEILNLRQQNQEEKYQGIDNKMKEELSKLATGERRNALLKLWDDDCKRNETISQNCWEKKNGTWFITLETFKKTYANKNAFIKNNEAPISYTDAASTTAPRPPRPQQVRPEGQQGRPENQQPQTARPLPQRVPNPPRPRTTQQNRRARMEVGGQYQPNPETVPEPPDRNDEPIGEGLVIMISNIFRSGSGQRSRQRDRNTQY